MTDTLIFEHGDPNRATYGTFPRLLGLYSRDLGLFSLEEAVCRMTSLSAQRLGLDDIGQIREGAWADLVVLDPSAGADHTTPEQPDAPPTRIKTVFVSGQPVAQDGQIVDRPRRGRVIEGVTAPPALPVLRPNPVRPLGHPLPSKLGAEPQATSLTTVIMSLRLWQGRLLTYISVLQGEHRDTYAR